MAPIERRSLASEPLAAGLAPVHRDRCRQRADQQLPRIDRGGREHPHRRPGIQFGPGVNLGLAVDAMLWFTAMLSVNLGLINLFPIPVLDGGHLLFYAAEAIRGRPLGQRAQEYGFRVGLALVLTLMVFATWNDLVHIGIVKFFRDLIT